jgi:hypothetical protein
MSSLVWLAIPLVALVLALLWVAWTSRTRPRAGTHETLEEHARFKAAFDTDRPGRTQRPAGPEHPDPQHADD